MPMQRAVLKLLKPRMGQIRRFERPVILVDQIVQILALSNLSLLILLVLLGIDGLVAARLAPLLSMVTLSGWPLSAIVFSKKRIAAVLSQ